MNFKKVVKIDGDGDDDVDAYWEDVKQRFANGEGGKSKRISNHNNVPQPAMSPTSE